MGFGLKLFDILTANATAAKSYINRMLAKKQDKLTFDSAPTTGSSNPVTSDGIRKAIDTATPNVDFSNYPTKNGTGATGTWPISISGAATKASQDSNGKVIADTYATKTEFNTVSKQAQTQADWNSTNSSSVDFIKNVPNSIKSINNSTHFRIKTFRKTDNHGWPTYRIVEELTNYHPTNRPTNWGVYGFSAIELCGIRGGNGYSLNPAFMYASLGYEYDMLRSTSSDDFPVVLHNTESDKYYVAIRTMVSYKDVTLMGTFVHPDIELGEEILGQDIKGTPPSGWELTYKPKDTLNMDSLQAGRANDALKLTTARAINLAGDASGSATFDGSKDITVNTTVNESKHAVNADTAAHANDVTDAVIKYDVSRTDGKFTAAASGVIGHLKNLTGSTDLTSMNKLRSYIGSVFNETNWFDVLSIRHRNGAADGQNFGLLMYSNLTNTDSIKYKKQPNGNGWTEERTLLDSSNYNNYAPTKTGEGASGTWDISITGNAVTANQAANDGAGNVITDTYTQKKEIKVSTDLDTLKETGFYNFPLSSICTDANHFPWGVASAVLVIKNGANGDGCTQICFPYNQEKFCKRTYMASTQKWHDWDTSAFMADLDSKQDKLVFDTAPTASSANAITSGAVKAYVDAAIAAIVDGDSKTY